MISIPFTLTHSKIETQEKAWVREDKISVLEEIKMIQHVEFFTSPPMYWVNASLSVPFKLKSWPDHFKNDAFQSTIICTPCNQFNRLQIHDTPKLICILSPGFNACAFCIMLNRQDECLTKKQILLQTKSRALQAVQTGSKSAFDNEEKEEGECEDDAVKNSRVVTSGEKRYHSEPGRVVTSGEKRHHSEPGRVVTSGEKRQSESDLDKYTMSKQKINPALKVGKTIRFDDGSMVPVSEREIDEKEVNKQVLDGQQSSQKKDLEIKNLQEGREINDNPKNNQIETVKATNEVDLEKTFVCFDCDILEEKNEDLQKENLRLKDELEEVKKEEMKKEHDLQRNKKENNVLKSKLKEMETEKAIMENRLEIKKKEMIMLQDHIEEYKKEKEALEGGLKENVEKLEKMKIKLEERKRKADELFSSTLRSLQAAEKAINNAKSQIDDFHKIQ